MRQPVPRELKRVHITAKYDPKTARFMKAIPGSNGRRVDFLVEYVRASESTGATEEARQLVKTAVSRMAG